MKVQSYLIKEEVEFSQVDPDITSRSNSTNMLKSAYGQFAELQVILFISLFRRQGLFELLRRTLAVLLQVHRRRTDGAVDKVNVFIVANSR